VEEGRGLPGHIFNLGHGILTETPLENVQRLVETVQGAPVAV
jgi:uroporphyrinogen decarboxylase